MVKAIHELPVCTEGGTDLSVCSYVYTVYQPHIAMFVVRSILRLINIRSTSDPFYTYVQEMIRSTFHTAFAVRCQLLYNSQNAKACRVQRSFYEDETYLFIDRYHMHIRNSQQLSLYQQSCA